MCGIAGLIAAPTGLELGTTVRRMAAALVHRGPDDEGLWTDTRHGVALAHRRLSIVDLSPQGRQPMLSASGRYVMVYNGEIYNHAALCAELVSTGRAPEWRGHSDTEVLLAMVEAWGPEAALARAVGMFAIALWDRESHVLLLARDRMGEKPLYYGPTHQGLAFASELKALRALGGQEPPIDTEALSEFMQFGYISAPRSIYQGWLKLPPGHLVRIDARGQPQAPQAYWRLPETDATELARQLAQADDRSAIDLVHDRLKTSVGLQMMADVPLGAFLSGGVDSSTVVALMQAQSARQVRTYTIGFQEKAFDEAPFARAVAQHLGTDHTELYVRAADAAAVIPELPNIYDEPFADSSQIPTTLVSRLTRQHVTVALSGDGGDELFAGYPRYAIAQRIWQRTARLPRPLRVGMASLLQAPAPAAWDRLIGLTPGLRARDVNGRRLHRLGRVLAARSVGEVYERLLSQWQPEDQLVLAAAHRPPSPRYWSAHGDLVAQMRHWDVARYLPDDLLVKVDRAAMSASLETRAPLLDHRVVETAFALPTRMLLREGQGKWILRQVLDRYVPRSLIERPKTGFSIPLAEWLRGPLRDWADAHLDRRLIDQQGLLDADRIASMWAEHRIGSHDRSPYLWNVLMFQAWRAGTQQPAEAAKVPAPMAA